MKRICFVIVTAVLGCAALNATDVGDRFPDFVLNDLQGRSVSWSDFHGKVVVLNLWMTTCPPCKKEMPMLQELQRKYDRRGVVVVGISADAKSATAAKFASKLNIKYPLLIAPALMTSESE